MSLSGEKSPLLPTVLPTHRKEQKVGYFERRRRKKLLQRFYEEQAELLELFEKDDEVVNGVLEPIEHERSTDRVLNRILFVLNVVLLFANLFAAIMSRSLSIASTFVDSVMDLTCSAIIGICLHLIKNADEFKYPRGRDRLEVLGVILCSVIMGIANMVIILQSAQAIAGDSMNADMTPLTLVILITGCSLKSVLMIVCYKRGTASSKVLAMDMRNDIATAVVAITAALVGDRYWKYADPLGAIIVCGMIAASWFHHAIGQVPSMTGVRGEREQLARILRLTIEHDERIQKIDHLIIYYVGAKAFVEMHIVMSEDLPLKVTHDISHPLEKKLNQLDFVERTFIHCDYDCDGD